MVRAALLCVVALVCGGCVSAPKQRAVVYDDDPRCPKAQPTAVEIRVFGPAANAVLLHGPEASQWYPARALDQGKFGSATLNCRIASGKVDACTLVKEDGHLGFGTIAMRLAKRFDPPPGPDGETIKLDYQFIILAIGYRQYRYTDSLRQPCPPPNPPLSDAALD